MGLILVRYVGEIGIKGKNRFYFVKRLRHNLRDALKRSSAHSRVWSEGQRVYAEVQDDVQSGADAEGVSRRALGALQRVFGVASLSPVYQVSPDMEAIQQTAVTVAERAALRSPMSFRIKAQRADKSFPYTSPEIGRIVGGAVWQKTQANVDLSDAADLTIGVEVRPEGVLVFGETIPGPGGMPLGTQGRVFSLLSGGIDSPVATWTMMRRGCGVIPLHFAQSRAQEQRALELCRLLDEWSFGWTIKPIVVDHHQILDPIANRLQQLGEERWTCLFCKRAMIAKAAELAPRYRVQAVVMGDSLGQVASQTMENMIAISWRAPIPIFRPLVACDKNQIMDLARRIGTYDVSSRASAPCPFLPDHPITSAKLEHLQDIMAQIA